MKVNEVKRRKLIKVKSLIKLTNCIIELNAELWNYITIRSNSDDLPAMNKAVHAVIFHIIKKLELPRMHCPTGPISWHRYNKDIETKEKKPGPIFNDPSSEQLNLNAYMGKYTMTMRHSKLPGNACQKQHVVP